jgi:hypothetical protein
MKESEQNQECCNFDMPNGLHGHPQYNSHFVKAPSPGPYPCNYSAEMVHADAPAMKITLGK